MIDEDSLREQLEEHKREHKSLDEQINQLSRGGAVDFLTIAKLKRKNYVSKTVFRASKVC